TSLAQMDLRLWGLAFISAFFGPTISRVLQMYALRYIPVSQSILFGMLTPIFTLFLAWGLFSHLPSVIQMVGGILILIGISIPVLWVLKKTANQTI
ncbi:MAG: drug/metabolite transporter (DMT)-like permease, partial [bacterium]